MPRDRGTRSGGTYAVVFGSPAKAIVDHAQGAGVDLIVMGTHDRSGVAHLLLGSVAERVVRTATCPVMTVRGAGKQDASAPRETATIGATR
jgi:nucleotide-binding universal stress UspA family protein